MRQKQLPEERYKVKIGSNLYYPNLIYRPPPRPPENLWPESPENKSVTKPQINIEFEENSLHQEGIISEFYQRPNKSYARTKRFRKFGKCCYALEPSIIASKTQN